MKHLPRVGLFLILVMGLVTGHEAFAQRCAGQPGLRLDEMEGGVLVPGKCAALPCEKKQSEWRLTRRINEQGQTEQSGHAQITKVSQVDPTTCCVLVLPCAAWSALKARTSSQGACGPGLAPPCSFRQASNAAMHGSPWHCIDNQAPCIQPSMSTIKCLP